MRKNILERLGRERLYCDGGTGSILQEKGLKGGELPERWNLLHPEIVTGVAQAYFEAGSDIVNSNTFGANRLRYPDAKELEAVVEQGVLLAKEGRRRAGREEDGYVALDIGPTGRLLKPMGDLAFEDAVRLFAEVVRIGAASGADLVLIETMSDSLEAKAAVLAAKENSDLPVFVTTVFDEKGKLLTGGTVESVTAMLEGLRVDAIGLNCGMGPRQMLPLVKKLSAVCSLPMIVNPNAGLPRSENGRTVYDLTAEEFSDEMRAIAALGVHVLGGCCGTTPEYIRREIEKTRDLPFFPPVPKHRSVLASFSRVIEIGKRPVIIGERINPTGKKKFKEALRNRDIEYILQQGVAQEDAGADMLDVNVGLPEIDEPEMMETVVTRLQGITALPLQIDTTNAAALERGLRIYNGKALINSVNGRKDSMETVFPLAAKYGGVIVGLTLDENGIPADAEGRFAIAQKIYRTAAEYGIPPEDIVIDSLAMTISTDAGSALATLETLRRVHDELDGHTILGVSNISFGLPQRELINAFFFTMALQSGLSLAIVNPNSDAMMASYRAFLALSGQDPQCAGFIGAYAGRTGKLMIADPKKIAADAAAGAAAAVSSAAAAAAAAVSSGTPVAVLPGALPSGAPAAVIPETPGTGSENAGPAGAPAQGGGHASSTPLTDSIRRGLKEKAEKEAESEIAAGVEPLELVNRELIPALDDVGKGFEKGTLFLPQLLMSAEAAKAAFEVVKEHMKNVPRESKGKVILATVKGDIHDIGKNIVKVLLENYGYDVIDLGRDVPPETVAETAVREDVRLVGLSALMTTTVVSMEETIRLLREKKPETKIVVGGAVMTQEYADSIGADFYAKEAMDTVRCADRLFGEKG